MKVYNMQSREAGLGTLVIPFTLAIIFLVCAIALGGWAFAKMLDYKSNVDQKVSSAVAVAKQQEDKVKDSQFAELEKQPLKAYVGPTSYGSITINYPKTWSGYVIDTHQSSPFIDGYFYPGVVPDASGSASSFALRVQLVQTSYADVLNSLSSFVQQGQSKIHPYAAPKVPNVVGVRVDGQLPGEKQGSMIILPLRNMTLKLWTEAPQFQNDFNNNILPNFTFAP